MKEKWKDLAEKKGIKKWFQRDNLIIIILSGVLLLIIALPVDNGRSSPQNQSQDQGVTMDGQKGMPSAQSKTGEVQTADVGGLTQDEYTAELELRLSNILSGISGVGKVRVMITLQSSEELVVEKDQPLSRSNTTENDAEGGSRSIFTTDAGEETVYRNVGSDSEPYVIKTLTPKVEGVVVVAQGAGSGDINKGITEAVQALFGLEAHKIKVLKMKASK